MSINQLNASYLLQEDRIQFRINTLAKEEFDFLLTRRVTLFILAASEHLVEKQLEQRHDPSTAKAMAVFEKENVVTTQTPGPSFEEGHTFPLGNTPLLVMDVTCGLDQASTENEPVFSIDFVLEKNQSINLKLPKPLLIAMRLLLENLCDQASWGRAVITTGAAETGGSVLINPTGSSSTLH